MPDGYLRRAAILLVLRPKTFYCNARDLALLESFIRAQVPRYVDLRTPTVIITGDRDNLVSPQINACAFAATLPSAKLVTLKDIGHMPPSRGSRSHRRGNRRTDPERGLKQRF